MKKYAIISAVLAALLLAGCGETEDIPEETAAVQLISSETAVTATETVASSETTAVSETEQAAETASELLYNGVISMPSEEFIEAAFGESSYEYYIRYTADGKYLSSTYEECLPAIAKNILNENVYETFKAMSEEDITFDEYKELICTSYGIDEKAIAEDDTLIIFLTDAALADNGTDLPENNAAEKAAFRYVLNRLCGTDDELSELRDMLKNGTPIQVYTSMYQTGDVISVFSDAQELGSYTGVCDIAYGVYITLSGEEVPMLYNRPVNGDIRSLYISAYDETPSSMIDGGASSDYEQVFYNYDSDTPIDIKELAEKFPDIEKLYFSKFLTLENCDAFARFNSLEELNIDVSDMDDMTVLGELGVQRLCIGGLDEPADFLCNSPAKELEISCIAANGVLESIFELKNVTELKIERSSDNNAKLDGIEKLTQLKRLEVSSYDTIDAAPIAKLSSVEELYIMADKVNDLDKISSMKSVNRLTLHSMETADLKFLSEMNGLEELYLYYVNSSFNSTLSKLTKLKTLSIIDVIGPVNYKELYKMKSLEHLNILGIDFDAEGISSLKKLNYLNLSLCSYYDLSELKKCTSLKNLIIYNCETPEFDAKDIEGMTWLEYLGFNCSEISNYKSLTTLKGLQKMNLFFCDLTEEQVAELKKALPDCEIKLDTE